MRGAGRVRVCKGQGGKIDFWMRVGRYGRVLVYVNGRRGTFCIGRYANWCAKPLCMCGLYISVEDVCMYIRLVVRGLILYIRIIEDSIGSE